AVPRRGGGGRDGLGVRLDLGLDGLGLDLRALRPPRLRARRRRDRDLRRRAEEVRVAERAVERAARRARADDRLLILGLGWPEERRLDRGLLPVLVLRRAAAVAKATGRLGHLRVRRAE